MMKKGELTTQQIVLLIVLIASFAIILFFLFRLNLGKETDTEICHNSVVLKGSAALPDEAVALDCKTSYVCLTRDGSCEDMTNPEKIKVKNEEDVYEALADKMADCWWMFGEGKVNYVGKKFTSNLYCSICSQVAFDDSVKGIPEFENGKINQRELYSYMENNNAPGKDINYLEYLFDVKHVSDFDATLASEDLRFRDISLDAQQYIIMGIYNDVTVGTWVLAGVGAGIAIGLVPFTGGASLGAVAGIISLPIAGGVGGYYAGTAVKGESGDDYYRPTIVEVNSETFEALRCKDIKTLA